MPPSGGNLGTSDSFAGTSKYTAEVPATSARARGWFSTNGRSKPMRKTALAIAAVAALATTAIGPAEARGGRNAAIGFGLAAGALGAAAASSAYHNGYYDRGYGMARSTATITTARTTTRRRASIDAASITT